MFSLETRVAMSSKSAKSAKNVNWLDTVLPAELIDILSETIWL